MIPKPNILHDGEHSKYSPSGSSRWMGCPASIQMEESVPEKEEGSNFYAEEGTCAHELGAQTLEDENAMCIDFLGETFNNIEVNMEMCKEVQKYVDYVRGTETWDSTLWVETRYNMNYLEESMFGTADTVCFSDTFLEVVDLKYGQGVVVEPKDNSQLYIYASGVLNYLEDHGMTFEPDFEIKVTIFQPRAPHHEGPVRSYYITVAQLREFEARVQRAVAQTKEEDPPFGPSEKNCTWCRKKPTCKPHAEWNIRNAQLEWKDLAEKNVSFAQKNTMSMAQITAILKHSKTIEKWLKSVVDYAGDSLRAGEEVPGYKLVYGRSNRRWSDEDLALQRLLDYGTDEDRLFKRKMLTAPQAEKELTTEEWELIEDLVYKPQGSPALAPESDPRPSIDSNLEAAKEFAEDA